MSRKSEAHHHEEGSHHLSILEAVENLSNIAEMDLNDKIGLIEDHVVVHGASEEDVLETISWLEDKSEHQTEQIVEETYQAVLKYVKDFHKKEFSRFYDKKNQEGIKKIMLLVGQASDKLKNFTHLFKGVHKEGVEETKAYRQLNKFYNERIAIEDGDKVSLIDLSRKDRKLDSQKHPQIEEDENALKSKQFVLDVEKTKEDKDYELLYIQREDGSRFLEPNFFRNIKAACNFGEFVGIKAERNPIESLSHWQDLSLHKSAVGLLKIVEPYLSEFYKEGMKYRDMEVVANVNMGLMALMLAACPKNRSHLNPPKSCAQFFQDFHHYLRATLASFEYQKLRSFPPPSSSVFLHNLLDVIHLLSWGFFFQPVDEKSLDFVLDDMLEEGKVSVRKKEKKAPHSESFWKTLENDFLYMQRYLMGYPIGPLYKTLQTISQGQEDSFDTFQLGNHPFEFQNIQFDNQALSLIRLPSPTSQEIISKVELDQEFTGLVDALNTSKENKKHLIVNLQDRTSWNEFSRSKFLEKLPNESNFIQALGVVTLSKTSDFYYQRGAYKDVSKAKDFFKQVIFHLHEKDTGFYFSAWVEEKLFNGFIEKIIGQTHRFFFAGKSTLNQEERQDFIEILYQLITLKLIELFDASSLSFTCKDSLDVGGVQTMSFYSFLKLISNEKMTEKDRSKMHLLLFANPILIRNRTMHSDGFLRMLQGMKRIEKALEKHSKNQFHEAFKNFFSFDLSKINFGKSSFDRLKISQKNRKD
ncbi:MAG: hypothetical protein S4CHLAM7_01340 [Chlamydiae bacterium]|nr:hypothetical protein [Chlamydiota bacterium]